MATSAGFRTVLLLLPGHVELNVATERSRHSGEHVVCKAEDVHHLALHRKVWPTPALDSGQHEIGTSHFLISQIRSYKPAILKCFSLYILRSYWRLPKSFGLCGCLRSVLTVFEIETQKCIHFYSFKNNGNKSTIFQHISIKINYIFQNKKKWVRKVVVIHVCKSIQCLA